MTITCQFCSATVEQYDATAGGADSSYSKGAAGTFDYPAAVECECGAEYCDGDLVSKPPLLGNECWLEHADGTESFAGECTGFAVIGERTYVETKLFPPGWPIEKTRKA